MSYEAYRDESLGFSTKQLHAGYNPEEHYRSKAVPVYQTAAFELGDFERCVRLFTYEEEGHSYSRYSNPTNEVLEKRLAALEGGASAVAFASGMSAIANTFLNLTRQGDEIIAVKTLYGGTSHLLKRVLPQYGVRCRFAGTDTAELETLITDKTKSIFLESLGNPGMEIVDLEAAASIARRNHIPLVVDNTFATSYLCKPFDFGADIVVYSLTKYFGGHGAAIGGLVIEKGGFHWLNGKFPQMEAFYAEYADSNGVKNVKNLFTRRLRGVYLTDMGAHLSPLSAFLLLQGVETLSLRMERHAENALKTARFLAGHPAVREVSYPGLSTSPYYALAKKYFPKGAGAIISLRLAGGLDAALRVLKAARLFDYMVNVGDAKSMIAHPATSTHFSVPEEERERAGVFADSLRLSIGIEDADDLIADLKQALDSLE
jgi:O-acetylhomoserine (thiol)-lyase